MYVIELKAIYQNWLAYNNAVSDTEMVPALNITRIKYPIHLAMSKTPRTESTNVWEWWAYDNRADKQEAWALNSLVENVFKGSVFYYSDLLQWTYRLESLKGRTCLHAYIYIYFYN